MKTTKVFVILNEQTMKIEENEDGKARMFKTHDSANEWASENINAWDIIKSHFEHDFLHHEPNQ